MIKKTQFTHAILVTLAILPICFFGFLLIKYSVNVPYWDQWDTPGLAFEQLSKGTLSFKDLFAQHNESRKFFPRIIFIGLAFLTHWDVRYEMLLTFLAACLVSLNIYRLSCVTLNKSLASRLGLFFVANVLIFSLSQWENWFWGIQLVVFMPILCITTCLVIALSQQKMWMKFLLCCGLAIISSFSYANGMLCWLAFLPALVFSPAWKNFKRKLHLLLLWFSAFILTVSAYFYNYQKPPAHPSLAAATVQPQQALIYFASFLGSPLAGGNLKIAATVGLLLLGWTIAVCTYLLWRMIRDRTLTPLYSVASWLIIAGYSIISGLVTTVGRVGFGIEQSLAPRYTTFSLYLSVAVLYLTAIALQDCRTRFQHSIAINPSKTDSDDFNFQVTLQSLLSSFIAVILVLHLLSSLNTIQVIQNLQRDRLYAKTCLIFVKFVDNECIKSHLHPVPRYVRQRARAMENMGFLEPDVARRPRIQSDQATQQQTYGWIDRFDQIAPEQYVTSGWAILPDKVKPADSVLLTYKDAEGKDIFFGLSSVRNTRADVAQLLKQEAYKNSGWEATVSTRKLPKGQVEIQAWAFDTTTAKAFPLNGSYTIQH
jgi:hypothetical protein